MGWKDNAIYEDDLASKVMQQESGGRRYGADGNILEGPQTKYGTAKGEMQVLDSTMSDPGYGVTPAQNDTPDERARVGRDYLAAMQAKYKNPALAAAAYNAGPSNVDKYGGVPPFKETQDYVNNVIGSGGADTISSGSWRDRAVYDSAMNPAKPEALKQEKPWNYFDSDINRVLGRTSRSLLTGSAMVADIPGMVINAATMAPYAIHNAFTDDKNDLPYRTLPLPSEGVRNSIDQLTQGKFKPQNKLERAVDNASEFMSSLGGSGLLAKGANVADDAANLGSNTVENIVQKMAPKRTADLTAAAGSGIGLEYGGVPGAIVGAVVGGGTPATFNKVFNKPKQITANEIKTLSNEAYKEATLKGGILKESFTDNFLEQVNKMKPQTEAGKIIAGDSPVSKLAEKMQGLKGRRLTLDEAQEVDELLGDLVDDFTDVKGISKQGKKILDMQTLFRNMIDDVAESEVMGGKAGFDALKKGRQLWSQQARLRDIEKIITRAELMDNPATGIKTGFRNLVANPKRLRGFSSEQQKAIRKAAESGMITDSLRTLGSRLVPIMTLGMGGGVGTTAAANLGAMASRSAATKLQMNKADKVARMIAGQQPSAPFKPQLPALGPIGLLTANMSDELQGLSGLLTRKKPASYSTMRSQPQ